MVIGEDIAVLVQQDARAQALLAKVALGSVRGVEEVVEETETVAEEEVVVEVVEEVINEQMVVAFKVAGTKQQLIDLTNYMKQNNIRFQKLEV